MADQPDPFLNFESFESFTRMCGSLVVGILGRKRLECGAEASGLLLTLNTCVELWGWAVLPTSF